jgi:branched-chain amino acid transport system ATP-binding protein
MPLLQVDSLSVAYGHIVALKQASLEIKKGELVALIGPNGAGKSTLLKAILGIQRPQGGSVRFKGDDITRRPVERIVASGIALVPEGRGVLADMTVVENLELGAYHRTDGVTESLDLVFDRFPILRERREQKAGTLSGGEQQMLVIARTLMAEPELIMMDEPSLGLAPMMVNQVFEILADMKQQGYTILLSEQNARKALQCADRAYVLELGKIALQGSADQLAANENVREVYLGIAQTESGTKE